ncbi:HNH endonuclease signature motif containing protein [Anaeromyxobacter oryzisoli]|uniref:HNH endonuclease signature motif containing protein n=1 Tax=Anaeromyxobacter oryzisoli TaxID=2925408 RepID=UPI001F567DD4|nr:HNH endonuclease signature motif containing protein [Anaeromyxobacter sp. SG63]
MSDPRAILPTMRNVGSSPIVTLAEPPPEALARAAWQLDPPMPHERPHVLREEAALLVDGLLARVARGRGALDVALGDGLLALAQGDRTLRLGYSGIVDYARERLGMAGRTAQGMVQLARALEARPRLREAVRSGEVSARKATTILRVALGEAEAEWVERARTATVRALEVAVRAADRDGAESASGASGASGAIGASAGDELEEERFDRVDVLLGPEARARLDEALALAGKLLKATSPRWERLESICQEYLGAHPVDADEDADERSVEASRAEWFDAAREALEEETACWAALDQVAPVPAPVVGVMTDGVGLDDGASSDAGGAPARDPAELLDEQLRHLASMRERWDELVGHLAMLVLNVGLWRDMGFATFGHYCAERLGMAERTVAQRAALERRLYALPALRQALRGGRISYEQARLVVRAAGASTDEDTVEALIAHAEASTCIAFRRELEDELAARSAAEAQAAAQMCAPPGRTDDSAEEPAQMCAASGRTDDYAEEPAQMCAASRLTEDSGKEPAQMCAASGRTDDSGAETGTPSKPTDPFPAQMCARDWLTLHVPRRVALLVDASFRAARAAAGHWLTPEECVVRIAHEFIETWKEAAKVAERSRPPRQRKILARDRGRCQVPGCSRPAAHVHHVCYRSQGGDDSDENQIALCAAHHLHAIHRGWIRVRGRAPDGLRWELGVRRAGRALAVFGPDA